MSKDRPDAGLRRPTGAEEGEAACRGRCGGGSASPTIKEALSLGVGSPNLPRLYVITAALSPGRGFPDDGAGRIPLLERLAEAGRGGLRMVQVRLKGAPEAEVVRLVTRVRAVLPEGSLVIVNATGRDPAFAGRVGADGAHVGGGDPGVVEAVRRALAPRAVIGFSAHGAAEIGEAARHGADYASLSPVFAPLSKESPLPPMGIGAFGSACRGSPIPVFALGGITAERIPAVRSAGAYGAACIGAVLDAPDPVAAVREILAAWAGERNEAPPS